MRLKIRKKMDQRRTARLTKKVRVRKKVSGTQERPRLSVFRSKRHIYAQVVDDVTGSTIVAASTLEKGLTDAGQKKTDAAKAVGLAIGKKAKEKNIDHVVFDRSGFVYHGRVRAVAEGAREAGLNF